VSTQQKTFRPSSSPSRKSLLGLGFTQSDGIAGHKPFIRMSDPAIKVSQVPNIMVVGNATIFADYFVA
jgi:hypothetical protein